MITNVKMRVTPDLVERIQEIVFANGGYWCGHSIPSKKVINAMCSIHINAHGNLSYSASIDLYGDYTQEEISAYDFIASQGEQKWLPRYGEECEFSDDGEEWLKAKFLTYRPKQDYKYNSINRYYKKCRPLPKTKIITIDGKSIEISADSFEALKKQLCEG